MQIFTFLGWLTLFMAPMMSGCSQTHLLTKQDYQNSQKQFLQENTGEALLAFPRHTERGDFITTMESTYLNLIQGKPQIKQLQKQVTSLEDRVRYHISREAKTFFYLQTPEDYYASEHEVIWLHFLLSWGYSLQGKYETACVEARVSSSLLSLSWSPTGHFDDPSLRLFLAGLWTMCGDWSEAQVDLRAAWNLDHNLVWAKELADHDKAPANLILILGGPGPEPVWAPELKLNPLRSNRQISFKLRGRKSLLLLTDHNGQLITTQISPDASKWYERHLERESELHELILDSAFGGKATASGAVATTKIAATTSFGIMIGLGGTALGAVMINAGLQSNSGDLARFGFITIGASWTWASNFISEGYHASVNDFKQDIDPSLNYRFVRFLPEYLWLGWSNQVLAYPLELRTSSGTRAYLAHPSIVGKTTVTIAFLADTRTSTPFPRRVSYKLLDPD